MGEILSGLLHNYYETVSFILFGIGFTTLLFNRNLLYTAVTRAKKCVTIVGSPDTIQMMISNVMEMKRYSGLKRAIQEM